jgi:acyl-CoA synthetase (AMP-forming)/AMP-acid ligase II
MKGCVGEEPETAATVGASGWLHTGDIGVLGGEGASGSHGRALPDPAEIISWSRENMARYKAPRYVGIVSELPFSAAGKVLRNGPRDRAMARGRA